MRYDQILKMVKSTNKQLISIGYDMSMIDDFWNECIKEAKKQNEQDYSRKKV